MSNLGIYIENVNPTGCEGHLPEDPHSLRRRVFDSALYAFSAHFVHNVPQHYNRSNFMSHSNLLALYLLHHYSAREATYRSKVQNKLKAYTSRITVKSKEKFSEDLMDQLLDIICNCAYKIPDHQLKRSFRVVELLAGQFDKIEEKVVLKYSVESEILFIRTSEQGNHYIFVGDEVDDLSYGFVGFTKGDSDSVHADFENTGVEEIVNEFLNG